MHQLIEIVLVRMTKNKNSFKNQPIYKLYKNEESEKLA